MSILQISRLASRESRSEVIVYTINSLLHYKYCLFLFFLTVLFFCNCRVSDKKARTRSRSRSHSHGSFRRHRDRSSSGSCSRSRSRSPQRSRTKERRTESSSRNRSGSPQRSRTKEKHTESSSLNRSRSPRHQHGCRSEERQRRGRYVNTGKKTNFLNAPKSSIHLPKYFLDHWNLKIMHLKKRFLWFSTFFVLKCNFSDTFYLKLFTGFQVPVSFLISITQVPLFS